MPLDGVSSRCLAAELNQLLPAPASIASTSPTAPTFCSSCAVTAETSVCLSPPTRRRARLHVSDEDRENPGTPPMFCMLLRKHLLGAR